MHEILAAKISADHSGQTTAEIVAALNAKSTAVAVPIKTADIKKYLVLAGKYMALKSSDSPAAQVAIECLNTFESMNVQEAPVLAKLTEVLDALIAVELLSNVDKSAILDLGQQMRSWSRIFLGFDVQEWQIQEVSNGN